MDSKNPVIDLLMKQPNVRQALRLALGESALTEDEITAAQHAWEQSVTHESWPTFLKLWPSRRRYEEHKQKPDLTYSVAHADLMEIAVEKIKLSELPDSNDVMGMGIEEQEIEIDADNYDAIPCRFKGIYPERGGLPFTAKLIGVKIRNIKYVDCTMAMYKVEPS